MDRLRSYLAQHLPALDLIAEYQQKRLPLALLFYKVCTSFPEHKLGGTKAAGKHVDGDRLAFLKEFLGEECYKDVLRRRSHHRPKIGQYVEFLATSWLLTTIPNEHLRFPSAEEDITEGWDFTFREQKYDITTNLFKVAKPGITLIKLDLTKLLDQGNLILPTAGPYLTEIFRTQGLPVDENRSSYSTLLVNKVREKYLEITSHEVILRKPLTAALISTPQKSAWQLPPLTQPILEKIEVSTTLQEFSSGDLKLLQLIKNLDPATKALLTQVLYLKKTC